MPNLGIATETVPSGEAFAPSSAALLPQYATTPTARRQSVVAWPPQRGCPAGAVRFAP
ncbi:hypothetical protein [Streptomyces mirabilis]